MRPQQVSGHELRLTFDGPAAIAIARTFHPDVVISDIGLPGELDGYALARRLRAESTNSGPYLIALTGYAVVDDVRISADVRRTCL